MRVRNHGMNVVTVLAPFLQSSRRKEIVWSIRSRVEINIVIAIKFSIAPIAFEQFAGVEVNDVVIEGEGDVILGASSLQLRVAAKSEDVVAHNVFFSVMLMKSAVRRAKDDVVFRENTGAAFVEINSPTAVTKRRDVVPKIITNHRARFVAERVDAAHVAENRAVAIGFFSDVMNVIEFNDVVGCERRPVTPRPADGNSGVEKIVNGTVRDAIAERLANPDSFTAVKKFSAVANIAVENLVVMRLFNGVRAQSSFANFNSTRTEIGKIAMRNKIALATAAKLQSIAADVFEIAIFK